MKDAIKNILPRIIEYSETLDQREIFADKIWLLMKSDTLFETFTFERNRVYKSLTSGKVKSGTWRILPAVNQVYIEFGDEEKYLYNLRFISSEVLIFSDNTGQEIFPFLNLNSSIRSIADLKKYLEGFIVKKSLPPKENYFEIIFRIIWAIAMFYLVTRFIVKLLYGELR